MLHCLTTKRVQMNRRELKRQNKEVELNDWSAMLSSTPLMCSFDVSKAVKFLLCVSDASEAVANQHRKAHASALDAIMDAFELREAERQLVVQVFNCNGSDLSPRVNAFA